MSTVQTIMQTDVIWIKPDETIDYAFSIMRDCGIRHLPVVDQGRLVGLISEGDILLRSMLEYNQVIAPPMPVSEVMTQELITCAPTDRTAEVAETMLTCKLDCVPVVKDDHILGIITTSDFVEAICREEEDAGSSLPLDYELRDPTSPTPGPGQPS